MNLVGDRGWMVGFRFSVTMHSGQGMVQLALVAYGSGSFGIGISRFLFNLGAPGVELLRKCWIRTIEEMLD